MNFDPISAIAQAQTASRAGKLDSLTRGTGSDAAARETAEQFESFFVSHMLDSMMSGLDTGGAFGGGHAEQMWRGVMNQEYGKMIARTGGLGIADQVYDAMIQAQAAADGASEQQ